VTARDKTTGREQSITVAGSSTLSQREVNEMIEEAQKFAQGDRERRERIEKRNRARALTDRAARRLKEVTLDFGSQFASSYRRRIETLSSEIIESLEREDERRLDRAQADLQDTLYEMNREVRLQYEDEEDESILDSLKRTFIGDDRDDDYYYYNNGPSYGDEGRRRPSDYRDGYRDGYRGEYRDKYNSGGSYYDDRERPRSRRKYDNYDEEPRGRRNSRSSYRNMPSQNNWDEDDDDDWF